MDYEGLIPTTLFSLRGALGPVSDKADVNVLESIMT